MILGLTGKMRAGKNECAKRLALFSPFPVVEVSFAAKLKESAAALLGCTVEDLERWKNEPDMYVTVSLRDGDRTQTIRSQTIRSYLQRYGTEAHREIFGSDFWLDAALPFGGRPFDPTYENALYVATDVRFSNEAQRVRDLGGWNVLVVGPMEDTGTHASEQALPPHLIDATIFNTARDDDFVSLDRNLSDLMFVMLGGSVAA